MTSKPSVYVLHHDNGLLRTLIWRAVSNSAAYLRPHIEPEMSHQVLRYVSDPIQALQELRRVVKPGGIVAVRESAETSWCPESPGLEAFWDQLSAIVRLKGGNPHPGKRLHVWAEEAGFERSEITCSADTWCFSTSEKREYWGESMDAVFSASAFASNAEKMNIGQECLKVQVEAWKTGSRMMTAGFRC
ncbi:MAG: hypothetical protein J3Q66DRAFT_370083 [Benniella sp.]|nr:MAG: hypothetical protein J3Q66DRAFT_370083 [Benniella sp.]